MAREGGQKSSFMTSLLHNSGGRAYRIVHVPVEVWNSRTTEPMKTGKRELARQQFLRGLGPGRVQGCLDPRFIEITLPPKTQVVPWITGGAPVDQ
jgi:hypothetical protein